MAMRPKIVAERGGWSAFVPGIPVAADGATFDEAVNEMADALREYAADWTERLRTAPNHQDHWALVQVIALHEPDDLRAWVSGAAASMRTDPATPRRRGRR